MSFYLCSQRTIQMSFFVLLPIIYRKLVFNKGIYPASLLRTRYKGQILSILQLFDFGIFFFLYWLSLQD